MKKKTLPFMLSAILIVAVCLIAFAGCNKTPDCDEPSDICRETLSFFAGESDLFAVTIESGNREKLFIADGKVTDVEAFTEIKITPLVKNEYESVSYTVTGKDVTVSGSVDKSVKGEFIGQISLDFTPETITVSAGDESSEIELNDVLNGCITSADAINIARETFKDKVEAESADGKPAREIYCKLISGDRTNYYFYVSFIGEGVDYWAVLISPSDGKVISKRS